VVVVVVTIASPVLYKLAWSSRTVGRKRKEGGCVPLVSLIHLSRLWPAQPCGALPDSDRRGTGIHPARRGMGQDGQIRRDRIIIDTDPGIDDSMTILMAFEEPSVEIIGLTTIFGNVTTEYATRNALLLCERAGHPEVPVAEGSPEPLKGGIPRVADFVHGSDGLGNLFLPAPSTKKVEESAAEFLVNKVSQFPGEISVLALGPLTNVALAIKKDSSFASKVKKIVVLGGAFFAAGNVNPAAEANVLSCALYTTLLH
jgi:hypothetical protein